MSANDKIREAMLAAAAKWHDEADKQSAADNMTGRTIAMVIAEAFTKEADLYRKPRPEIPVDGARITAEAVDEAIAFDAHDPTDERWKPMNFTQVDGPPENPSPAQSFVWDELNKQ